ARGRGGAQPRLESGRAQEGERAGAQPEGVGAALEEIAGARLGLRGATRACRRLEHHHLASARAQRAGRGEPGRSGADDRELDVAHASRGGRARAASVNARPPPTGVSGRPPWPRFSTWPRAGAPARATRITRSAIPAGGALSAHGSRAPTTVPR